MELFKLIKLIKETTNEVNNNKKKKPSVNPVVIDPEISNLVSQAR